MFTGELVTIKGVQTGYYYSIRDVEKKYPYPIHNDGNISVIKEVKNKSELKELIEEKNIECEHTVYVVLKNRDFTEGRGPMCLHKVFKNIFDAEEYISQQKGIYGSEQNRYINVGTNINNKVYASVYHNGYDIEPAILE
jgi:hypothetical protein